MLISNIHKDILSHKLYFFVRSLNVDIQYFIKALKYFRGASERHFYETFSHFVKSKTF